MTLRVGKAVAMVVRLWGVCVCWAFTSGLRMRILFSGFDSKIRWIS